MHNIHCGSAVFPYQALETRPAQEALRGYAGLHNKRLEGIEHCEISGSHGNEYENDHLLRIEHSLCKRSSSKLQDASDEIPRHVTS
jgi:hypothetical protein